MKRQLLSGASGLVLLAFAGSSFAATPGPADLKAIVGNLQPTVDALASGLQNTVKTLATTQSAVQTSNALGDTLVDTASAAINGAPTLGSFSIAGVVINSSIQNLAAPVLTAIDNPTPATIKAALAPSDLATMAQNLQPAIRAATPSLKQAAIDLLHGNLTEGLLLGLIPKGGTVAEALTGVNSAVVTSTSDTNLAPLGGITGITALAVPVAAEPVLSKLDGPAQKLGDKAAPLTDPIVQALNSASL